MRKHWLILGLIGIALLAAVSLAAQGAPDQITIALNRLSAEVNRNVTLDDPLLSNWSWSQDLYPDLSLGCPQPDTAYAQTATQGFSFLLTYNGVVYDYRVSADGNVAFLCSQVSEAEMNEATPTPPPADMLDTSVGCLEPEPGVIYMPRRLTSGIQARAATGINAPQHSDPTDAAAITGEVPSDAIVTVTGGPVCADGQVWWQVNYDGNVGWTSEGNAGVYWLDLAPTLPLPANLPPLTVENAALVTESARAEANITPALAADQNQVAVPGGEGTPGVWLYDLAALDAAPRLLFSPDPLTSAAYGPDGRLLLLGDARGGIHLWSTAPDAPLLERWFDQGHEKITRAVAFSPDGRTVASAGDAAVTRVEVDKTYAIVLWDIETVSQQTALAGHTAAVNTLAFSPDGALLASASEDQTIRLWNPTTGESIAVLSGHKAPVNTLAFSPDGSRLASGSSDGAIIVWDLSAQAPALTPQSSGTAVRALAFSPDGALLASAGGDEDATQAYTITLWDATAGTSLVQLSGHTDVIGGLAFNGAGTVLTSVSQDHSIRFWAAS